MIRNLKILTAAAMAMTAFAALGASSVQAAEFHCTVEPCQVTMKADGTGKTAHHVIFLSGEGNFSTTCNSVTGEATLSAKTSSELTIGNIQGNVCSFLGARSTLTSNGCHYLLNAAGTLTIVCPPGKVIENTGSSCSYDIPPQGPLPGVKFHNAGSQVTAEINAQLTVTASGAGCPGTYPQGQFTTANVLLTSETDPGGVIAGFSWE
jgi:hypothetical protein